MLALSTVPVLGGVDRTAIDGLEAQLRRMKPSELLEAGPLVLTQAARLAHQSGVETLTLEVEPVSSKHEALATEVGLEATRTMLRLERSLPLEASHIGDGTADGISSLEVRPFDAGRDVEQWLALNNRAFSWHPEQGGWDRDDLNERMAEPWFDPAGFLLHQVDGQLAGFCWTKIHTDVAPPIGEIYVIGVDPSFQGRGLGRDLVLAGLDHLTRQGLGTAMLYVEADNDPALTLYRDLGFATAAYHVWWNVPFPDSDSNTARAPAHGDHT